MSFDDNIDLNRVPPKQGRRGKPLANYLNGGKDNSPDIMKSQDEPFLVKKTGGWAGDGIKSGKTRSTDLELDSNILLQQTEEDDSDDDIPVIPDIDDLTADTLSLPEVKIPNMTVKKTTYNEIDRDNRMENLKTSLNLVNLGDLDLSLLTAKLYPEPDVQAIDEVWTLESLGSDFSRIAQLN